MSINTMNLPNQFPGARIKSSSDAVAVAKISVTASQNSQFLQAVTVNFGGSGFAPTDLANLVINNIASGVALYDDAGSTVGYFDGSDAFINASSTAVFEWSVGAPSGSSTTIYLATPAALTSGVAKIYYVVIRTSSGISNNDQIVLNFGINSIVTSDGSGPSALFSAPMLVVDTTAPAIQTVAGFEGNANLVVTFSEPVQRAGGGNLTASQFTFVDNGTVTTHSTSSVTHIAGQNSATVTLTGNLDAGDFTDAATSTLAAATNSIADMAGNVMGTSAVNLTSPITITTASIPNATSTAVYTANNPLVTFASSGGTGAKIWSEVGAVLSGLGLALAADTGKLTSNPTVANVTGNYSINIKATDAVDASTTRSFILNIGNAGGTAPGISLVSPPGGAQGTTPGVTVTGINTSFSASTVVQFFLNGSNDTNVAAGTITANSSTSLAFTLTIAAGAAVGTRDLKVTTGTQIVYFPNAFAIFAAGIGGLALNLPIDGATGVPLPPNFSFDPSTHANIHAYRIMVKQTSDLSGTTFWDYAFPTYAMMTSSHCGASTCGVAYGVGQFMILSQPAMLSPGTTYYWTVRTYAEMPYELTNSSVPLETAATRSFTTTSSITDAMPPTIIHRPIFTAPASAALSVFARVMDNIATASTSPALSTKIIYCKTANCTPTTEVTGTNIGGGYYKFDVPVGDIGAAGAILRYWLWSSDGTNSSTFKNTGDTPFQLTTMAVGSNTITGSVLSGVTPLAGAYIFADGTGFHATTTNDGNATFSIGSLPTGTYDLTAISEGYGDRRIDGVPTGASSIAFNLTSGGGGGFGGDLVKPRVRYTGPPDGMTGVPGAATDFKVFMVFGESMSQNPFQITGNIVVSSLNPATGVLTDISSRGTLNYYLNSPPANAPQENSLAVWALTGGNALGDNTTVVVRITPNITDTAGNSIQGNQPDGSYSFSFVTGANFAGTFTGGQQFGSGAFNPPHVIGTNPPPGTFDIPRNLRIGINFSDPMADDGSGYLLKNYVKLCTVASGAETDVSTTAISAVALDSSKTTATITLSNSYNSGLFAASTTYRVKVLGGAKAANNLTISQPGMENQVMFTAEFRSGASSDTTAPTVVGSFPDNGATAVPVNAGAISVGFSRDMDVSTITTSSFYLSVGSTAINGAVDYRPMERQAYFIPRSALNATTTYTINVTTDVRSVAGVALASAVARTFTTSGADIVAPSISFINADDYSIAITYSEPMNAAKAVDTINYPTSVLKPSLYTIKQGATGNSENGAVVTLGSSVILEYDAPTNTAIIKGLSLTFGSELYVLASGVRDASGNAIGSGAGDTGKSPIRSSATTGGALGPMAMSSSSFSSGGSFMPSNFSGDTHGFARPVEVRPFNTMAGQTTIFGVRVPIATQIPAGGMVVLTFPSGFDVSGARQDINSPMRSDLNGQGAGTIQFKCNATVANGKTCSGDTTVTGDTSGNAAMGGLADDGVLINAAARTITIYLSAATNSGGMDFLSMDIAGIRNSTVPKDYNTSGYTVDTKTKNGATLLESLTSMPFFIQASGSYTLSGTITATGNDQAGTMKIYIGSPMTGPLEADSVAFDDATSGASDGATQATYSFSNLPAGEYHLFTDQAITLGSKEFAGKSMPERVSVTANTTYNFTLASNTSGGTAVTVNITGPANEPLDIFAGSSMNFRAKQVTLNGSGVGATILYLANGQWMIGVGPQMPKGPMSGPPPAPSYLPPQPVNTIVQSTGSPVIVENSGTVDDGIIVFALTSSDKIIRGTVKDGASKIIANAEVYAYSPQGGMGTHAQANASGQFTLNVVNGSYVVGAFVPGMPSSKEVSVMVNNDPTIGGHATNYLFIDGATTGVAPAYTAFTLSMAKPDYTISGKVTDGTNVIQGASVYAYRSDGPGNANANTDSAGKYTLYVSNGSWRVGAFLPQYGNLTEQSVAVSGTSAANINFSPTQTGTFYTVSGTATINGAVRQGVFVRIVGNSTFNETITGSDGTYSFKVPSCSTTGCYTLKAFAPGVGELPPLAAFSVTTDTSGKDFTVGTTRTITILISETVAQAMVDLMGSTGIGGHSEIANGTSTSLTLPDGDYRVKAYMPGINIGLTNIAGTTGDTVYSNTTGMITVNGNESLTITLPTLRTVSGAVVDGAVNISDAWVEIMQPSSGIHFGTRSASNGTFSLKVGDSAVNYMINAMKPGYFRTPTPLTVNGANAVDQTLNISTASLSISGQISVGSSGAANAFVRAEKQGGGFSGTQADSNGNYVLPVDAGTWRIYGVAEGYAEVAYASNPITVASSVTGRNITLSTTVSLNAPKSKSITPSSGGTLEDTTAGVKVQVPANALGSSNSAGNLTAKETNNVRGTGSARPFGGKAKEISATDSNGSPITTLNDSVTVEMSHTIAESAAVASASDSSIDTKSEADTLKMAYWDETTANWVSLPTTVTYKDAAGAVLNLTSTDDSSLLSALSVATIVYSAITDHFSLYAPIVPTNPSAPSTPTGISASANNTTSQITVSWTAVSGATSYDVYRSTSSSGTYTRLGTEPTTTGVSYINTGLASGATYYYKVTSLNASGESAASSAVSATTLSSGGGGGPVGGGGAAIASIGLPTPTPTASPSPSPSPGVSPSPSPLADPSASLAPATAGEIKSVVSSFTNGDLVKLGNNPKVYIVKGQYRRWIQNPKIFNLYGHFKWNAIKTIVAADLAKYAEAWLVRADGDKKVYEINSDGTKHWLNMTAEAFTKSGRDWNMVYIVNKSELNVYKTGADVLK